MADQFGWGAGLARVSATAAVGSPKADMIAATGSSPPGSHPLSGPGTNPATDNSFIGAPNG